MVTEQTSLSLVSRKCIVPRITLQRLFDKNITALSVQNY